MYTSALGRHAPLYEIKANLFKALAHPVRIRVLELLTERPGSERQVGELLSATGLEASHLSQHLAVLRRHHVVVAERRGSAVYYRVAHPRVADLLAVAREFLVDNLDAARDRLTDADDLPALGR